MVRPVYRAGYATRGMLLEFAREVWLRYLSDDVDYFVFPTLEEQDEVANRRQDAQSAVRALLAEVCLVRLRMRSSGCLYP